MQAETEAVPSVDGGSHEGADTEQTATAKTLTAKKRATRQEVDRDSDSDADISSSASQAPGLEFFSGLRGIAPFLWLVCQYAESYYPKRKSPQSKLDQFTKDHAWLVRFAFIGDLLLRAVLVGLLLIVVARGVGLDEFVASFYRDVTEPNPAS